MFVAVAVAVALTLGLALVMLTVLVLVVIFWFWASLHILIHSIELRHATMPRGTLLIGPPDTKGHGLVVAATGDLHRRR